MKSFSASAAAEHVVRADGVCVALDDIARETSFDLYQTDLHYQICRTLARQRGNDDVSRKVLENLYALKSDVARRATALVTYVDTSAVAIASIRVSPAVRSMLPPRWAERFHFENWDGPAGPYVAWNHVALLLAKAVLHRLFRLLMRKSDEAALIVRAWVEVTAAMYPAEIRSGRVLIYPFALNVRRQLKFVRWCHAERLNLSLAGLPYPLGSILADIMCRKPNDQILASAEIKANARHALELLGLAPRQLFTSDEFETASFVLYDSLVSSGVEVINTAHGVGNYCPNIVYSEFRVVTPSQQAFYSARHPSIRYTPLPTAHRQIKGLPHYQQARGKPVALVLVHQPFESSPLKAEESAQWALDNELQRIALTRCVEYRVKMHPNYHGPRDGVGSRSLQGPPVFAWSDLSVFRPIFVTINSTVFFDCRGIGPMLVYAGLTFRPNLYFPEPFMPITLSDAEHVVSQLLPEDAWERAAAFHAEPCSVREAPAIKISS